MGAPGRCPGFREYLGGHHDSVERRLVRKIDFFILTFCCLSYFFNYLDRSNLANAYVSGMKEELGFQGDQYNQINTCFTVGYVIGQIPSNLSLHFVKPRYFFPSMMLLWASLTVVTAAAHAPGPIMAIRFFQGIAESSTFVGAHYILGSWYNERELGKRSGIFTASGLAGTMIGGFVQSGIHRSMNGLHGLSGWRYLFIIDGIITVPVAIASFSHGNAVGILSTLFWATLTDVLAGKRYLVGYFIGVTGIATSVMILAASTDPTSGKSTAAVFGAYYWAGAVYACQATFFAWANDALRFGEPMLRAVVLAGMNLGSGAVNAWWSLIFYGAATAPWFKAGMWAMMGTSIALMMWTAGLTLLCVRDERRATGAGGNLGEVREST
ncbi:hypothetical protein P8C59_004478 [Phyllachora maydis]|uniref:Major facilitator superfamily (MFS) profile domain-containing protein n=1 Tax=Phyllachora maydis TaxID=1825666 RepID=A0AAD9I2C4_9PEZI|nr:hypothetical protein P8C59_004478 [Phyllachora maydis]